MNFDITEEAKCEIQTALQGQADRDDPKTVTRIEAKTNGTSEFAYALKLIRDDEVEDDDNVLFYDDLKVVIDPKSAGNLEGAVLGFEDRIVRSGFKFENPNKPEVPKIGDGKRPDLKGEAAEKVQMLLDSELNPAVAAHGGQITLMGVQDNKVYLSFGGGCHGCGMVDVTLKQGVETRIRELIPEIAEVIDTTDHSTGDNPFYV